MPKHRQSLPYRPCAGAMLINRAGLVFAGHRAGLAADDPTAWQMPQGGIDPGEEPLAAARRELWEETSVRSAELVAESVHWLTYDVPDELASGRFARKWRGQTQKWFAFRFTGPDSEIDIVAPGGGAHPAEFDAWAWLPLAELPGRVVPFKRPIYEALALEFASVAVPA
jgi:putative (di)nucleoside polyphosphate hydrolase